MEKIKKILNSKTIIFAILIIALILVDFAMYSKFIYSERSSYIDDFLEHDYELKDEQIKAKNGKIEIVQTVTATGNNLKAISIGFNKKFRTYNDSQINIKIVDKQTQEIISEYNNIYDGISKDYIEHKFNFKKQEDSFEKKYDIIINYENGLDDNSIFYSEKKCDSGVLTINGEEKSGHISFRLYYNSKYANTIFAVAMIFINILAIIAFYIILYKQEIKLDKIFLGTISILGIIYLAIIPMYRGHDEHAHFFRAYEISKGIFNTKIKEEKESITEIPKAFVEAMIYEEDKTDTRYMNEGYYRDVIDTMNEQITDENVDINGSYMAVYSMVPYIPQALAIKVVSSFTNRVLIIFYAARLANLIVAIAILYIAFKIIPYGKKIIFLICMIPTVLCQISSMSPDAMTFTSSILLIAYVLKIINDNKKLEKKNIAILAILGVIVGLCKITYIPLVFITLLIPKELYNDKKSKIISLLLIILLPVIMNIIWLGIANEHLALIDNNKSDVQKSYILSHPIEYFRTCAYTLYSKWGEYIGGLFGQNLEHINVVKVGDMNTHMFLILFILVILFDDSIKGKFNNFGKIVFSAVLIIILALIWTSLYMQWSGYKWFFVDGIQGRYFIPLLLPLCLLLGQNNIAKSSKINLTTSILSVASVANVIAILSCVITYI